MAVLNGTAMKLYYSTDDGSTYNEIAKANGASLSITHDTREVSTKSSAGWREHLESFRSWTVSGEHLYDDSDTHGFAELFALIASRAVFKVKLDTEVTGEDYFEGNVLITEASLEVPMEDNASTSFSFQGTGPLTLDTNT